MDSTSSTSRAASAVTGVATTMGPLFFASLFTMGLWGAGFVQIYYYYSYYPKDSLWLKIHVLIVWLLDTLHEALVIGTVYRYLIEGFGVRSRLMVLDKLLVYSMLVSAIICIMVQSIFVMRIWKLSRRNVILTGIVVSLVLAQFIAACIYFGKAVQFSNFPQLQEIMTITRIVSGITAGADSAIALSLVALLHRNRTGFKQTQTTINKLIMFTINTGLVTSLCAIIALIMGFVLFETLFFMLFNLLIGRLYMNSLLASLNSRNSIRSSLLKASNSIAMSQDSTEHFRTVSFQNDFDGYSQRLSNAPTTRVSVTIEKIVSNPMEEQQPKDYDSTFESIDLGAYESGESTPMQTESHAF